MTLRSGFRPLRSQFVFPTVRRAIADTNRHWRERFRIVHFSIQADHAHLIVEASDREALLAGVKGLAVRLAKRVNRLVFRRGRVFVDRWHGRALSSPRAVRNALLYVLANFKKHREAATACLDPYSSSPYFRGFLETRECLPRDVVAALRSLTPRERGSPVAEARGWLLRVGWTRHGLLSIREAPSQRTDLVTASDS